MSNQNSIIAGVTAHLIQSAEDDMSTPKRITLRDGLRITVVLHGSSLVIELARIDQYPSAHEWEVAISVLPYKALEEPVRRDNDRWHTLFGNWKHHLPER